MQWDYFIEEVFCSRQFGQDWSSLRRPISKYMPTSDVVKDYTKFKSIGKAPRSRSSDHTILLGQSESFSQIIRVSCRSPVSIQPDTAIPQHLLNVIGMASCHCYGLLWLPYIVLMVLWQRLRSIITTVTCNRARVCVC